MKRLAVYLFFDNDGIVDDYIPYKLEKLKEFVQDIWFVSNSGLTVESRKKIEHCTDYIMCRENVGFDVWGYKEALEKIGFDKLSEYDEVILLNYTFFAPIFPFSELFEWSEKQVVDFWGISDHGKVEPNPFTGSGVLHKHIQSHFIAIRKSLLLSYEFQEYWNKMPMITSYTDSVLMHESRFTHYFYSKGYNYSIYVDSDSYGSKYPTFYEIDDTFKKSRSPILKRRPFFHDPLHHDRECIFLRRALQFVENSTEYPLELILNNILRTSKPKDIATNLTLLKVFDSSEEVALRSDLKILLVAHVFYADMLSEILNYAENIPCKYDLLITTSSQEQRDIILNSPILLKLNTKNIEVLIVEKNRGRDMSSLFITCKNKILNSAYDWVCRLHSKKSPQNGYTMAKHFKEMMYHNLLKDRAYVSKVLNYLDSNPSIGFAMPSMVHIGYPTLGHAWYSNKPLCYEIAKKLDINVPFDDISPFAAYGTMFWFRPQALRKLFVHDWKFEDFNKEPMHHDGSLAHALERLLAYTAHDAGFLACNIMSSDMMELNYTKLEYKMQRLVSNLSNGDIPYQIQLAHNAKYIMSASNNISEGHPHISRYFLVNVVRLLKNHVLANYPRISRWTRLPYRKLRHCYHKLRG
ncbi:rhamnan synthesis F family protein [Pelistega suis]|uniref:rhamnan synthesis F family protein n=1 Tax=Pelistega suis TaxID=1631957 RepID=UPI00211CF4EA|nr:rhamnan synthesis F family protein [Pelistega suis]MCQ9328036.1 hypothetical protein [Pelistega suis]